MNLLQEMGMAAMAYKAKGNDDNQSCVLLVVGFNGALRYWWDNSLDSVTRESIINHTETRTIENTEGDLEQVETQNAVEVLIHTITMHFIGNPKEELESKKIILTNLRCPTLGDFKWYKDVFVTNIFQRNDCTQAFWKERFIAGLPTYFAERVTNKLKEYSVGQPIPSNSITYGQLFAFIKKEGLAICQEHKIKGEMKNSNLKLIWDHFVNNMVIINSIPHQELKGLNIKIIKENIEDIIKNIIIKINSIKNLMINIIRKIKNLINQTINKKLYVGIVKGQDTSPQNAK
ncbi:unnamed protein product [Brassica oleracea var. botrytis]